MKNVIPLFTLLVALSFNSQAQDVTIPDANFKAYLVGNASINTNSDTEIQVSEANAFSGEIACYNLGISDLTGIEEFTSLTALNANTNSLQYVDLSQNVALTTVLLNQNNLDSMYLGTNSNIDTLLCAINSLDSVDFISGCLNLVMFNAADNLDLTYVDFSANLELKYLFLANCKLSQIDVSQNVEMTIFDCRYNMLPFLDLSLNPALEIVHVQASGLLTMNLANGTNTLITQFTAHDNFDLTCIQVDDPVYSTANWPSVEINASFSTDCLLGAEDLEMGSISIFPNPATDVLHIEGLNESVIKVQILDVYGKAVQDVANNDLDIDISALPSGAYFLRLDTTGGINVKRFIKK